MTGEPTLEEGMALGSFLSSEHVSQLSITELAKWPLYICFIYVTIKEEKDLCNQFMQS